MYWLAFAAGFICGLPAALFVIDWALARYLVQVARCHDPDVRHLNVTVKGEDVEVVAEAVRRELLRAGKTASMRVH